MMVDVVVICRRTHMVDVVMTIVVAVILVLILVVILMESFTAFFIVVGLVYMHAVIVGFVCVLVGCLTSQQHASVSQGRI